MISAPVKVKAVGIVGETVLLGINEDKLKNCDISSNASFLTTNAGSPLIAILDEKIGIEKAILNTVHGYTASQSLVDSPSKRICGRSGGGDEHSPFFNRRGDREDESLYIIRRKI